MANFRPSTAGNMSSSNDSVNGGSGGNSGLLHSHPEEWTLPHEWNIEKRENYANWKMDVQNQIAYLGENLDRSLQEHPNPDIGDRFDYTGSKQKAEEELEINQIVRRYGNPMNLGVARSVIK